jgi:hypothetical protein
MKGFFNFIYEIPHGIQSDPVWRQQIYTSTGILSLLSVLVLVLFFYFFLNWFWAKYYKISSWLIFMALCFIVNFLLANFISMYSDLLYSSWINEIAPFSAIAGFYSLVFYFFFSYVLKRWSRAGRRTPF